MPLPQGMLANHTWHLVIQEGKQSLIRSCLIFLSFLKLALNHSSMKSSISRVNKTQIWSGINCVDYFLLLLKCISYFSSTCLTSTRSHTLTHIRWDAHLLTFSVHHFAVAMPRAYCPGTAESLKLHTTCWFFRSPSVAHTNIFSPSCRSHSLFFVSVLHTQTHSLSPLHTHTEFSPPPPVLTVLTEGEASISRVISL